MGEGSPVTKLADEACDLFKRMPKSQHQNKFEQRMTCDGERERQRGLIFKQNIQKQKASNIYIIEISLSSVNMMVSMAFTGKYTLIPQQSCSI